MRYKDPLTNKNTWRGGYFQRWGGQPQALEVASRPHKPRKVTHPWGHNHYPSAFAMTSRPGKKQQPLHTTRRTKGAHSVIIRYFIWNTVLKSNTQKKHGMDARWHSSKSNNPATGWTCKFSKWVCMVLSHSSPSCPTNHWFNIDSPKGFPRHSWHELVACGSNNFNIQLQVHKVNLAIKDCGPCRHLHDRKGHHSSASFFEHLTLASVTNVGTISNMIFSVAKYWVVALSHAIYLKLTPLLRTRRKTESHAIAKTPTTNSKSQWARLIQHIHWHHQILTKPCAHCEEHKENSFQPSHQRQQITLCTAHSAHQPLTSPTLNQTMRTLCRTPRKFIPTLTPTTANHTVHRSLITAWKI